MLSKPSKVIEFWRSVADHVIEILKKYQTNQEEFERQIPESSMKGFHMPWSEEINTYTLDRIKKLGYRGRIISEESGPEVLGESEDLIYFDPVDGSRNASHRIPYYSFSAGWYKGCDPYVAYIRNLSNGDEFMYYDGKVLYNGTEITKLIYREPSKSGVLVGRPQSFRNVLPILEQLRKRVGFFRIMGAASLDMALVGTGFMDAFIDVDRGVWMSDIAAARIILESMGGKITDLHGNPMKLHTAPGSTTRIIASFNEDVHNVLMDVVDDWIEWIEA